MNDDDKLSIQVPCPPRSTIALTAFPRRDEDHRYKKKHPLKLI
jgi:hypothetical protein